MKKMELETLNLEALLGLLDDSNGHLNNETRIKNIHYYLNIEREKIKQKKLIGETLSGIKTEDLRDDKKNNVWSNIKPKVSLIQINQKMQLFSQKHQFYKRLSIGLATSLVLTLIYSAPLIQPLSNTAVKHYAILTSEENDASWYVEINQNNIVLFPIHQFISSKNQDLELWAITAENSVFSLGILNNNKPFRLKLPQTKNNAMNKLKTIAVSLEKKGGSATGQPQGKIIYNSRIKIKKA